MSFYASNNLFRSIQVCLGTCVMFLHTPHMYFRLQPVCSVSLCSVGFANVDDFLGKCVLQKRP